MDTLQKQLDTLSVKVEGLHQLIEQLGLRVSEILSECKVNPDFVHRPDHEFSMGYRHHRGPNSMDASMEHKDVLVDSNNFDPGGQSPERQLSPEIQIQRLTAQLTAAYSRIAALEEQLISRRVHH